MMPGEATQAPSQLISSLDAEHLGASRIRSLASAAENSELTDERDPRLDIRRPELLGVRREGTARWFKEDKVYGRITADDGEILWVWHADIEVEGFATLKEGQRVSFLWNGGIQDHGRRRAEAVRLVDATATSPESQEHDSPRDPGALLSGGFVIQKVVTARASPRVRSNMSERSSEDRGPEGRPDGAHHQRAIAGEAARVMLRRVSVAFTAGFLVLGFVAFLGTGEIGVVILVAVMYVGIMLCGLFVRRWVDRTYSSK
jgi:CspA family cold shock protein